MRYVLPMSLCLSVALGIATCSAAIAQPGAQPPPVEPPGPPRPPTVAEQIASLQEKQTALEAGLGETKTAASDAALAGHNAWMLTSCALVLLMTAPGLAFFYSGLVRKKNVLSVMMQCVTLMALMSFVWGVYGYSLAFGGDNPWIGNFDYVYMENVDLEWPPTTPMEGKIPRLTHMLFQGMFFVITPALIVGAFAERMKFSTMVVFMVLWGTFIYCPLAHWVWDTGVLAYANENEAETYFSGGALDFAGGTVVHMSSGFSALICALLVGRRLGFGSEDMRPHNLTYTAMGAAMLWIGWFGFNGGSQLASDGGAASAFAATHFAAATGALGWVFCEWLLRGKASVLGACSGIVAGLVCITPASGHVHCGPAMIMGAAAGVICYWACTWLKSKFKYDDALDAFGIHGIGGTLGALLTGVFATRAVWDVKKDGAPLGLWEGGQKLIFGQIMAVLATMALSVVGTFIILKVLDVVMGLRVSQQQEIQGLDVTQHGEEGYIFH